MRIIPLIAAVLLLATEPSVAGEQAGALQPGMDPEAIITAIDAPSIQPSALSMRRQVRHAVSPHDPELGRPVFFSVAGLILAIGLGGFIRSVSDAAKARRK